MQKSTFLEKQMNSWMQKCEEEQEKVRALQAELKQLKMIHGAEENSAQTAPNPVPVPVTVPIPTSQVVPKSPPAYFKALSSPNLLKDNPPVVAPSSNPPVEVPAQSKMAKILRRVSQKHVTKSPANEVDSEVPTVIAVTKPIPIKALPSHLPPSYNANAPQTPTITPTTNTTTSTTTATTSTTITNSNSTPSSPAMKNKWHATINFNSISNNNATTVFPLPPTLRRSNTTAIPPNPSLLAPSSSPSSPNFSAPTSTLSSSSANNIPTISHTPPTTTTVLSPVQLPSKKKFSFPKRKHSAPDPAETFARSKSMSIINGKALQTPTKKFS